ncbi:hypothetical protein LTR28_006480 [Elasticomyces elasticus]|nr:hypothetical protein LTR28_006480 [Elasticomyces elasticus]
MQMSSRLQTLVAGNAFLLGQAAWHCCPQPLPPSFRGFASQTTPRQDQDRTIERGDGQPSNTPPITLPKRDQPSAFSQRSPPDSASFSTSNQTMPPGWEDSPEMHIEKFSQLPHRYFGTNQHIKINDDFKETLRQILWQFRAPIRYAFAYGSGVFSQSTTKSSSYSDHLSPHPNPPEAVKKWQSGGGKIIDFMFGVSHTQHWHSLNMAQHPSHYSALRYTGSYALSRIQDSFGACVYFNPYITVNGTMIKYGVVNLSTICRDLSEWDTLYLAGRLQKPVKILRDDPRVRLANQINLISAVRTALLMLPERFTERELYERVAGISYMGDPRMRFRAENPKKVDNIVAAQLPNFRQLYVPLIDNLPNVLFTDHRLPKEDGWEKREATANSAQSLAENVLGGPDGFQMQQDMDPVRRGNMVRRLPQTFRQKLYYRYQTKFKIPGSAFDKIVEESRDEDASSFRKRQGGEFEQRIAQQADLEGVVAQCIRATIGWPSTTQSIKGIFTAGLGRSWRYYGEKRRKNREGGAVTSVEGGGRSEEKGEDRTKERQG